MTASRRPVVAAFDVDRTLTTRDCVTPFLYRTVGLRAALALVRQPVRVSRALARRDRDSIKAAVCTAFAGMEARAVDARGAAFAREIERRWLRPRHVRATTTSPGARRHGRPRLRLPRPLSRSIRIEHRSHGSALHRARTGRARRSHGAAGRAELPWAREGAPTRELARRVRDHRRRRLGVRRLGGRRRASCPRGPSCPGRPWARRCRPLCRTISTQPSQGETPCTTDSRN